MLFGLESITEFCSAITFDCITDNALFQTHHLV